MWVGLLMRMISFRFQKALSSLAELAWAAGTFAVAVEA
jgi:hypothetical protein